MTDFPGLQCVKLLRVNLVCVGLLALPGISAGEQAPPSFIDPDELSWKVNSFEVARWKTLIGGSEGGQISDEDIQFGLWELAPRAIYHGHRHEVPEVYHITAGRAAWTVDDETREVSAGMTIYTRPGSIHRMVNLTDEPVKAVWFWWAPDGRREVFKGGYEFVEPAPTQPDGAGFPDGSAERRY